MSLIRADCQWCYDFAAPNGRGLPFCFLATCINWKSRSGLAPISTADGCSIAHHFGVLQQIGVPGCRRFGEIPGSPDLSRLTQ